MRYCPNCQAQFDDSMVFCSNCGTALVQQAQPNYYQEPQYQYQQPMPGYPQPVPVDDNKPSTGRLIVGMVLSLFGLEGGAVLLFIYAYFGLISFIISFMAGGSEQFYISALSTYFSVLISVTSIPCSIIGLAMSNKSIARGAQSKMCKIGRITGIIGLILCIVPTLLSLVSLIPYL